MTSNIVSKLSNPVLFSVHSQDFERACYFLRFSGYSVQPSDAHARRFLVGDGAAPYADLPALPTPAAFDPPLALELASEDIIGVIISLQVGGFRVFALLEQPGRYEVQDAYLQGAAVMS